jgi:hypothetical protein
MCYHHLQGFKTQGINSIELIVRDLKKNEECITSLGEGELTKQPTKLGGCYLVIYNNGWSQIGKAFKNQIPHAILQDNTLHHLLA